MNSWPSIVFGVCMHIQTQGDAMVGSIKLDAFARHKIDCYNHSSKRHAAGERCCALVFVNVDCDCALSSNPPVIRPNCVKQSNTHYPHLAELFRDSAKKSTPRFEALELDARTVTAQLSHRGFETLAHEGDRLLCVARDVLLLS